MSIAADTQIQGHCSRAFPSPLAEHRTPHAVILARRFCSPAFVNSSGNVPATLTYGTFTLTLSTGACALTTDFTPDPHDPNADWLGSKGFVCKTPELTYDQARHHFWQTYVLSMLLGCVQHQCVPIQLKMLLNLLLSHHLHNEVQEPTQYVAAYTAPATLITQSCKVAKNTTDGWTKTLYSGGDPTQYASMDDLKNAILNGTGPSIWTPLVTPHTPFSF